MDARAVTVTILPGYYAYAVPAHIVEAPTAVSLSTPSRTDSIKNGAPNRTKNQRPLAIEVQQLSCCKTK